MWFITDPTLGSPRGLNFSIDQVQVPGTIKQLEDKTVVANISNLPDSEHTLRVDLLNSPLSVRTK